VLDGIPLLLKDGEAEWEDLPGRKLLTSPEKKELTRNNLFGGIGDPPRKKKNQGFAFQRVERNVEGNHDQEGRKGSGCTICCRGGKCNRKKERSCISLGSEQGEGGGDSSARIGAVIEDFMRKEKGLLRSKARPTTKRENDARRRMKLFSMKANPRLLRKESSKGKRGREKKGEKSKGIAAMEGSES